jgi:aerobic carbon-monoxide dehydrogenase medium subunit
MKPAPFKYEAPTSLEEVLAKVDEYGYDGKILAGGQSLIPTMNFRLSAPEVLIDINGVSELDYIRPQDDGGVVIGALARASKLERDPVIAERVPLITETMPHIAHPQIRSRSTFGGTIAHADPAAELPAVSMALNARFHLQNTSSDRWVAADEFFFGMFMTLLEPEEVLTEIEIPPMSPRGGFGFVEVARQEGDYALVGVAATVILDAQGQCEDARIVYMSVEDRPVMAAQAVEVLKGQKPSPELYAAAAAAAQAEIDPTTDIHASSEFRRHLVGVLGDRVLKTAFDRALNKGA